MKHLFIGGTWDGERRTYIGTPPEQITAMSIHNPTADVGDFYTVSPYMSYDYEEYFRRSFQVADVEFVVYTHGRIDAALIMQRLLDHYTAENKA